MCVLDLLQVTFGPKHSPTHEHQAEHNISIIPASVAYDMLDPGLTSHGIAQCERLQQMFPYMNDITHVVSSPLRRALETAKFGFKPLFDRGLNIVAYPDLREKQRTPSSTGTAVDLLQKYCKDPDVDLSLLAE